MSVPPDCIDCDKVAVVLDGETPYCTKCYTKNSSQSSMYRGGRLSKRKLKP